YSMIWTNWEWSSALRIRRTRAPKASSIGSAAFISGSSCVVSAVGARNLTWRNRVTLLGASAMMFPGCLLRSYHCGSPLAQSRRAQQRQHALDEIRQLVLKINERNGRAGKTDLVHADHLVGDVARRPHEWIGARTGGEALAVQSVGFGLVRAG